ncbi:MAG: hypothetical protein ACYDDF_00020 [Thermoplasmatota archaeon]
MPPGAPSYYSDRFDRPVTPRKRMMAVGRKTHFMYDLREILRATKMDEARYRSFAESLFAKGSRVSTDEAKIYLREKVNDNTFREEEAQAIADLVERYSFWR